MNILENELVRLRALEPRDVDIIYDWENDTDVWQVSNTLAPFSKNIINKYVNSSHQDIYEAKQLRLMIDARDIGSNPLTVGTIDLFDFEPYHNRAGIGILIGNEKYRNKGYASSAIDIMIEYCFKVLALNQVYCNINANNEISIKLFQSKGFVISGTKKAWTKTGHQYHDEHFMQLLNM